MARKLFTSVSLYVLLIFSFFRLSNCSAGDQLQEFHSCLGKCLTTGSVDGAEILGCKAEDPDYDGHVTAPFELKFTQWSCESECMYRCAVQVEERRKSEGLHPLKYHGKWAFKRVLGAQEPASVLFSVLNFLATLYGLLYFLILIYLRLPKRPQGSQGPYYEYTSLWIVYGFLALNSWFWSAVFHTRDTPFTEAWDYSSAIALIGGVLTLAIIRTAGLRLEAARVMVSAPIIGFVATHILYLNNYDFDYGWDIKVCVAMGVAQVLLWVSWGWLSNHPSKVKLTVAAVGASLAMLLELYDFPPYFGVLDAHSCWHFATVPLTLLWWSFVHDDARLRTEALCRKSGESGEDKKKA